MLTSQTMTKRIQVPNEAAHPTMAEGRIYLGDETKMDPKDEREQRESFRKRKKSLFKNANAIGKRCKAKEKLGWPPTAEIMANIYPLPNAATSANYEPPESVKVGSEVVDWSVNTPEEETQQMERELSAGLLAMAKEKERRTFVIPRAPKLNFDGKFRYDIDREEVERSQSVSKCLQGNIWELTQKAASEEREGFQ